VRYAEHPLPPTLGGRIAAVWSLTDDGGRAARPEQPIVPDGCAEIVLHLTSPPARIEEGAPTPQPSAMIVGQLSRPTRLRGDGPVRVLGIRLRPWSGGGLFGIPMRELRDRFLPAEDVWPELDALRQRLLELPDARRAPAAIDWLADRLPPPSGPALAERAVRAIAETEGRLRPRELARELAVSLRTIQRAMADDVGLSPAALARVFRIQAALRRLRSAPDADLGRVGLAAGFYDHAHFCREFRSLTGLTPSEFVEGERALTAAFLEHAPGDRIDRADPTAR
jgi:AraC-like DNA-binding protein